MFHELLAMFDVCIFVCMHIVKTFTVIGCMSTYMLDFASNS